MATKNRPGSRRRSPRASAGGVGQGGRRTVSGCSARAGFDQAVDFRAQALPFRNACVPPARANAPGTARQDLGIGQVQVMVELCERGRWARHTKTIARAMAPPTARSKAIVAASVNANSSPAWSGSGSSMHSSRHDGRRDRSRSRRSRLASPQAVPRPGRPSARSGSRPGRTEPTAFQEAVAPCQGPPKRPAQMQ